MQISLNCSSKNETPSLLASNEPINPDDFSNNSNLVIMFSPTFCELIF